MNRFLLLVTMSLLNALSNQSSFASGAPRDELHYRGDCESMQKRARTIADVEMVDSHEAENTNLHDAGLICVPNEVLVPIVSQLDGRSALALLGSCKNIRERLYYALMPRIVFESGVPIAALKNYISCTEPKEIKFLRSPIFFNPSSESGEIEEICIRINNMSDELFAFIGGQSCIEVMYLDDLDITKSVKTTIKTMESIGQMTSLKKLTIRGGDFLTLAPFANLTSLQSLFLWHIGSYYNSDGSRAKGLDFSGIKDLPNLVNVVTWRVVYDCDDVESIIQYRKGKNLPADTDIRNIDSKSGYFGWNID